MSAHAQHRLLIIAITAVLGVAIASAVLWLVPSLFGPFSAGQGTPTVRATVSKSISCSVPNAHDAVTFQLNGKPSQAQLDGCGAMQGSVVNIVPPEPGEQFAQVYDGVVAVPAGYRRIAFALLALSGIGGGVLVLLPKLRRQAGPAEPEPATP